MTEPASGTPGTAPSAGDRSAIGTGIPAANNTHEVARSAAPDCRVVYVDYDPVVLEAKARSAT